MRFDAEGYGYRTGTTAPHLEMYTYMEANAAFESGWSSSNDNVFGNEGTFTQGFTDLQIGAFAGHEEVHQRGSDGPNHNTGQAYAVQTQCGTDS